jgi:opacity protein-like surface antigen
MENMNKSHQPASRNHLLGRKAALPTLAACLASALSGYGQQASTPAAGSASFLPAKPAWLTDLSLGVKESWDNNIMLVSGLGVEKQASMITTISPKAGVDVAKLLGKDSVIKSLTLAYTPDFAIFHDDSAESYNASKAALGLKIKTGDFSLNAENAFSYVAGSSEGPMYPGNDRSRSAYATAAPRERRNQIQDRAKIALQYDMGSFFARPTASLTYYDLMTHQRNVTGYQNYADRYDVNGGVDFGYKITKDFAATLGYRYGNQCQQHYSWSPLTSSSDYQRVLVGVEGKLAKWLTISLAEGPDFRHYGADAPVHNRYTTKNYGEAAVTAEATKNDIFTFKYKQWQWMSSTGLIPYLESSYDLSYKHKFSKDLSLDVGAKVSNSDYTCGTDGGSARNDIMYTYSVGLNYNITSNLMVNAGYAVDLGRNLQDNASNGDYRQFDHHVVSLGATFKF